MSTPIQDGLHTRPFSTLLVANRGEIAVRVIRGARAAGLRTVAVYSDADRDAPHVRAADVAVRIGPTPAAESYLSIEAILDAARRTGADAVHPGYGFLSERAAFARAVTDAGLVFVGPSADVMDQMGRKDVAREVATRAGVPVVPSAEVGGTAPTRYPVLVKAAAGGGGKGMRIVRGPADLDAAIASARREALSAFGDDTLLVERYVERGRHVEVQVLADAHGSVVHLFERDCSAQRRHQKVVEEAPAPTISEEVRRLLTESSVALARQVGYVNAGTVEFLVDGDEVFFLEMNTRLQVEHPVTEMVTGLDLVQLQLAVAAGRPLPFTQEQVACVGHAFEARVYAEDAFGGFLPQAGVAEVVRWSDRARVDAALESGQAVSSAYDPMLGKVVVHGPTREAARRALVTALDDTAILGLTTNLGFLRGLVDSDAFAACDVDTAWLDRNPDAIRPQGVDVAAVLGAWALATGHDRDPSHPFGSGDGWRVSGPAAAVPVELVVDGGTRLYRVDLGGEVRHEDRAWAVHPVAGGDVLRLEVDGLVHEAAVRVDAHAVAVSYLGSTHTFSRPDPFGPGASAVASDGTVTAPMPGTVLSVTAVEGRRVAAGEVLAVLEAMKMELSLTAPFDGTVARVAVAAGEQVALGATVVEVPARRGGHPVTLPQVVRDPDLPDRVTIYEVGPRDGLQNESGARADRDQGPVRAPASRRRAAGRRVDQLRAPPVGPAARGRRRAGRRARRTTSARWPVTCRSWCPTSAASTGRSRRGCATSRCSEARRRRSRGATSTASLDEQFAMFEPTVRRARDPAWTCGRTCPCASATRGRARCPSARWSTSAGGCSTSAPPSSPSATRSGWGRRPTSAPCSGRSTTPGCRTGRWPCTSTTPTARRSPTRWRRCAAGSPRSTRPPAGWAAARTPGARPATSPPRTSSGCSTASASSTASTSRRSSTRRSGWPGSSAGRARRRSSGRSPGPREEPAVGQTLPHEPRRLPARRCTRRPGRRTCRTASR